MGTVPAHELPTSRGRWDVRVGKVELCIVPAQAGIAELFRVPGNRPFLIWAFHGGAGSPRTVSRPGTGNTAPAGLART